MSGVLNGLPTSSHTKGHGRRYLKGLRPVPPPGDFWRCFSFIGFFKIGQNRVLEPFWGGLGCQTRVFHVQLWIAKRSRHMVG